MELCSTNFTIVRKLTPELRARRATARRAAPRASVSDVGARRRWCCMLACLVTWLAATASPLVSIRAARREDASVLRALAASVESHVPSESWFEVQIAHARCHCLIATLPGSVIAGIALARLTRADDALPGRAHLSFLVVAKKQRRRGCGRLLVQSLRDRLVAARATSMSLYVRESNGAALRFYRKLGFRVHTRVRGYYRHRRHRRDYRSPPVSAEDALLLVAELDELDFAGTVCTSGSVLPS